MYALRSYLKPLNSLLWMTDGRVVSFFSLQLINKNLPKTFHWNVNSLVCRHEDHQQWIQLYSICINFERLSQHHELWSLNVSALLHSTGMFENLYFLPSDSCVRLQLSLEEEDRGRSQSTASDPARRISLPACKLNWKMGTNVTKLEARRPETQEPNRPKQICFHFIFF